MMKLPRVQRRGRLNSLTLCYSLKVLRPLKFPQDRTNVITGGGQPTDHGTIITTSSDSSPQTIPITSIQRHGLRCVHLSPVPIPTGTHVRQEVNFTRRWDHMRQHTGQHLLSAIMDTYDNLETLGWGMGTEGEMNYVELPRKPSQDEIQEIQDKCNEIIRENVKIIVETPIDAKAHTLPEDYDKEKGVVRVIKIGDIDCNPYVPAAPFFPLLTEFC